MSTSGADRAEVSKKLVRVHRTPAFGNLGPVDLPKYPEPKTLPKWTPPPYPNPEKAVPSSAAAKVAAPRAAPKVAAVAADAGGARKVLRLKTPALMVGAAAAGALGSHLVSNRRNSSMSKSAFGVEDTRLSKGVLGDIKGLKSIGNISDGLKAAQTAGTTGLRQVGGALTTGAKQAGSAFAAANPATQGAIVGGVGGAVGGTAGVLLSRRKVSKAETEPVVDVLRRIGAAKAAKPPGVHVDRTTLIGTGALGAAVGVPWQLSANRKRAARQQGDLVKADEPRLPSVNGGSIGQVSKGLTEQQKRRGRNNLTRDGAVVGGLAGLGAAKLASRGSLPLAAAGAVGGAVAFRARTNSRYRAMDRH